MMPGQPVGCVLLADRRHAFSDGVRGLLEAEYGTVVTVADEASLLEATSRLRPDVVVVDLSLSQHNGLDWLRAVRARAPKLGVIVLSAHDEEGVRAAAFAAGADTSVLKRAIAIDLLPAIARVRGSLGDAGTARGQTAASCRLALKLEGP